MPDKQNKNKWNGYSLPTPFTRVLLPKLTGQLVKKYSTFYETWRFIIAFRTACYMSLTSAGPIQSMPPPPSHFLMSHFNIFPSMPTSTKWSLSLTLPCQHPICTSPKQISFFLIWSSKHYLVRSRDDTSPCYAVFAMFINKQFIFSTWYCHTMSFLINLGLKLWKWTGCWDKY